MLVALLFGADMNRFACWNSDKVVLRLHRAREVDANRGARFFAMVRELAACAGLPTPRVYLIDEPQPNGFATGRSPEGAAATTSNMQLFSEHEWRGVMANELTRVKNRDTLIFTVPGVDRRGDFGTGQRIAKNQSLCPGSSAAHCGSTSRDRADDDHQSPVRWEAGLSSTHPPSKNALHGCCSCCARLELSRALLSSAA